MNPGHKWEMTSYLPTAVIVNLARPPCSVVRSNANPDHHEVVFRMRLTFRSSSKADQLSYVAGLPHPVS